jgi:endonuclease YncB( thermonuclease family)|tara:strand:- start:716 stop:1174 length:459 start_codon:yes stop_codon:yes gene_type:complete
MRKKVKIKKTNKRQNFVYRATVDRVYDGDTIWVTLDLGFDLFYKCSVRLKGIDTPESKINIKKYPERTKEKQLAKVAKKRMKELCGKEIWVESKKVLRGSTEEDKREGTAKEKYGRVLGNIYQIDGTHIAETLIFEGLAVRYSGKKKTHVWK